MNDQTGIQRVRLIKLPEVISLVGIGRTEIYEQMKLKKFPQCVKNGRNSLWVESEIIQYNEEVIRRSRPQQAANVGELALSA